MKITVVEKLEIKNGTLRIDYSPENTNPVKISLFYTCSKCDGYGCSSENKTKCFNGEISLDIKPENLKAFFADDERTRSGLLALLESLCDNLSA